MDNATIKSIQKGTKHNAYIRGQFGDIKLLQGTPPTPVNREQALLNIINEGSRKVNTLDIVYKQHYILHSLGNKMIRINKETLLRFNNEQDIQALKLISKMEDESAQTDIKEELQPKKGQTTISSIQHKNIIRAEVLKEAEQPESSFIVPEIDYDAEYILGMTIPPFKANYNRINKNNKQIPHTISIIISAANPEQPLPGLKKFNIKNWIEF